MLDYISLNTHLKLYLAHLFCKFYSFFPLICHILSISFHHFCPLFYFFKLPLFLLFSNSLTPCFQISSNSFRYNFFLLYSYLSLSLFFAIYQYLIDFSLIDLVDFLCILIAFLSFQSFDVLSNFLLKPSLYFYI